MVTGIIITLVQELKLRNEIGTERKFLYRAVFLVILGFIFSVADVTGLWCNPNNKMLHGHAIWHLLTSVSLLQMYHYYAINFDLEKENGPLLPFKCVKSIN